MERPIDDNELDDLCIEYLTLEDTIANLSEARKTCKAKIDSAMGNLTEHSTAKHDLEIKRPDAYTWDQEELESLSSQIEEIQIKYVIDKKTYEALPRKTQALLANAFTTKKGRATLSITTKE